MAATPAKLGSLQLIRPTHSVIYWEKNYLTVQYDVCGCGIWQLNQVVTGVQKHIILELLPAATATV